MPTKFYHRCPECKKEKNVGKKMFDVLLAEAKGANRDKCNEDNNMYELIFDFEFGLNAGDSKSKLLDCFLPEKLESWTDKEDKVTFYPFLVIFKRDRRDTAIWLPYWHIVEGKDGKVKKKYGQWAPYMDKKHFDSLCKQAMKKGYLIGDKKEA